MWNMADYLGLLFLGYGLLDGYRKGFVKKGTSLMLTLVTLFVVYLASPYVEEFFSAILPEFMQVENLIDAESELYRVLVLSGLEMRAESSVQAVAARVLAWIVTYLVVRIFMRTLFFSLEILVKVPGLSLLNRLLGAGLGMISQLVVLWLFFLVIMVFSSGSWGNIVRMLVVESCWIHYLYDYNLLLLIMIILLIVV